MSHKTMREEEFDTRRHRQPLHVVPDAIWGLDGVSGLNCKHQCESLNHPFCLLLTPKSATQRPDFKLSPTGKINVAANFFNRSFYRFAKCCKLVVAIDS